MPLIFYQLFLRIYKTIARAISPFNPKARRWVRAQGQWKEQWQQLLAGSPATPHQPVVWMHASSLGEFEQGAPVANALKAQFPHIRLVITFFSPSGYEVRKNFEAATAVGYLPFDHPRHSARFVQMLQPSLVLWVKYEYWYFTLKAIQQQQVPLMLISGIFRPGQPFFKWYGGLHRQMLACFTHFFVQNDASARLLQKLVPAELITTAGDTRTDRVWNIAQRWQPIPAIENWLGQHKQVVVAGSTWPADEEELVHYFKTHPEVRLILAPHHMDAPMLQATQKLFPEANLYTQWINNPGQAAPAQVLIIDIIGILAHLYNYATIAYIGGGFTGDGVHNVLEAAVYGKPIVHGPEYEKYAEAVALVETGASWVIESALELEAVLNKLLNNPAQTAASGAIAARYVATHKGATAAIVQHVQENLRASTL